MRISSPPVLSPDGSKKYLIELGDGKLVEAVYLIDPRFFGVCASTQVGCNMGCVFCATAQQPSERNLSVDEIVGQALLVKEQDLTGLPFDFVTLSGMGEPLVNYANSVAALEKIRESFESINVVSLSTVGLTDKVHRLIEEKRTFRLYFSMHATTDETRRQLIPMAKYYRLEDLIDALSRYGDLNSPDHARVSYLLLKGVNDSLSDLNQLIKILKGRPLMVQLLFWNEVDGLPFQRVSEDIADEWLNALHNAGIQAYKMVSMGRSVGAGCGQLTTRKRSLVSIIQ